MSNTVTSVEQVVQPALHKCSVLCSAVPAEYHFPLARLVVLHKAMWKDGLAEDELYEYECHIHKLKDILPVDF